MKIDVDAETTAFAADISANAKLIRETLGLSLRQAADAAAAVGYPVAHTFITKLESGAKTWSLKAIIGMAAAYDVDPRALLLPPKEQALLQMVRDGGPLAAITWARSQI